MLAVAMLCSEETLWVFLHPKVQIKPRPLSRGKTQGLFDINKRINFNYLIEEHYELLILIIFVVVNLLICKVYFI